MRSHDHRASHHRQSVGDLEMRRNYFITGSTTSRIFPRSWMITWGSMFVLCKQTKRREDPSANTLLKLYNHPKSSNRGKRVLLLQTSLSVQKSGLTPNRGWGQHDSSKSPWSLRCEFQFHLGIILKLLLGNLTVKGHGLQTHRAVWQTLLCHFTVSCLWHKWLWLPRPSCVHQHSSAGLLIVLSSVCWGDSQSWCCSSRLLLTGDRIFNCNLLKVGCVFVRSLSWRSVGIHSLQTLIPAQKSWHISSPYTHPGCVCYLLLKALSVLPVLLELMGSPVQSVPYLLEALASLFWKLLESNINNYCNPPRAELLGNAAQRPLPKEEASEGIFASLSIPPHPMEIPLHTATGGWPRQNLTMCSIGWA